MASKGLIHQHMEVAQRNGVFPGMQRAWSRGGYIRHPVGGLVIGFLKGSEPIRHEHLGMPFRLVTSSGFHTRKAEQEGQT